MAIERATVLAGDPALLQAFSLTKDYGTVRAVENLSFEVRRGEIVGLLGPNGAGKTTAMRILIGYQVPTEGRVLLAGQDVFREGAAAKMSLGYLPENPPLYAEMQVGEYLAMAGRLKDLRGPALASALERVRAMLRLSEVWTRPIAHLSRGFRQRVGLGQCLIADPALLVLDEPATGLDPNQIADLRALLSQWRAEKAILLSTHILAEALMLCDRVLVLSHGRLVAEGSPHALAGEDDGRTEVLIRVRSASDPLEGPQAGASFPRLAAHLEESPGARRANAGVQPAPAPGSARPLWRIEGSLDASERERLLAHLSSRGCDLLEWSSGLSALEHWFRRLTLEEGDQRKERE